MYNISLCFFDITNELESAQGSPLYILPLPNNRVMKLYAIYSILHISFCNIFVKKEKI